MEKITEEDRGVPSNITLDVVDDASFEEIKLIDNDHEEIKQREQAAKTRPEIATKNDVIETRIKNGKRIGV